MAAHVKRWNLLCDVGRLQDVLTALQWAMFR